MSLASANRSGRLQALTGHKFFLLFIFLLASLIFYPYVENGGFGYFAFRIFGSAGILVAVYAIRLRKTLLLVALLLAIPALLERILLLRADAGFLSLLNIVLSFVFDVFIVVAIFHRVFTRNQPNSETVFGALCIYLLVGFTFASVYGMVAVIQPKAFYLDPADESSHDPRPIRLHLLQLRHDDLLRRGRHDPRLFTGSFPYCDRSHPWHSLSCCADRGVDGYISALSASGFFELQGVVKLGLQAGSRSLRFLRCYSELRCLVIVL